MLDQSDAYLRYGSCGGGAENAWSGICRSDNGWKAVKIKV